MQKSKKETATITKETKTKTFKIYQLKYGRQHMYPLTSKCILKAF